MKRFIAFASIAGLLPMAACATTAATGYQSVPEDDYRISVEIPLEDGELGHEQILRIDELLDERTEFDSGDFQLDEVVLIARSQGVAGAPDVAGSAELLVLEWRSGEYDIPVGADGDWYEVRIPAPEDDPGGAWLLDLGGDVAVDFLVVVMEPRPRVVAEKATRTRTVYRTVDGRRYAHPTYWVYNPARYYTYHYYDDLWPYRYFAGVWDYRYYHVGFRPDYHRFGYYGGPRFDQVHWRDRYRSDRRRYRHGYDPVAWRLQDAGNPRPRARYSELKRSNVRLRNFHPQTEVTRSVDAPQPRGRDAKTRYEEAKRTHPRLRQFHRNSNAAGPQDASTSANAAARPSAPVRRPTATAPPRRATTTVRRAPQPDTSSGPGLGNDYGGAHRASPSARQTSDVLRRIPTLRNGATRSRSGTPGNVQTRRVAPTRATNGAPNATRRERSVSPRLNRGAERLANPTPRARAPVPRQPRAARRSSNTNVRARTFQRRTAPTHVAPAPVVRRPAPQPTRSNTRARSFDRAAPRQTAPVRVTPSPQRSSSERSSSSPRRRDISTR